MNIFDRLAKGRPAPEPEPKQPHQNPTQSLLTWLQRWPKPTITPREIRIYGPKYFRSQEKVIDAAEALVRFGWLSVLNPRGKNMHEWRIARKPTINPVVGS